MGFVVLGAIVVAVALFAWGFSSVSGLGTSNMRNDNVDGCKAACDNLIAKRSQTCSHRAAVAAARAALNAAALEAALAVAASVAAAVAVGVASAVPIVGQILAAALATVAAAAAAYAVYALGKLAGAASALKIQSDGLAEAVRLEAEAMTLVTSSCPADTAVACIASLPACPV